MRRARVVGFAFAAWLTAAPAAAQQSVGDIIGFLVTNQSVPTADFERDRAAADAARATIERALLVNLTSMPLATSSSGFLYRLNPQLGTVERATESFGGFFVERALTPGRGHASFGVSGSIAAFGRLNGATLRDGSFITVANQFSDEPEPFDLDTLTLRIRSSTLTMFGSVGVDDRLEIGGAVPFIQLRVDGERVELYRGTPALQASGEATASGIGDIALRAKYMLFAAEGGAVAAGAEVRLPTGDEANLLGTGSTRYRLLAIGSYEVDRLTLNGNAGVVFGGISDELSFAGAAAYAVRPRVTISGEVLLRRVDELGTIELSSAPHPDIIGVDTFRLTPGTPGMVLANAVAGVKWNVGETLVLGAHVAFPLARRGLTAPLTPTVALEWSH